MARTNSFRNEEDRVIARIDRSMRTTRLASLPPNRTKARARILTEIWADEIQEILRRGTQAS